jgi:hypothetical protein
MIVTKGAEKTFLPHDEGTFRAVCVDITPPKKRETRFGIKEEFRIVFETDAEPREDGSRQCVWSRGFTPFLSEKANLRKFLRQWFGRDLTAAELEAFDMEELIDRPAQLVIVHEQVDDKTYANIAACTPFKGKEPLKASGKFVRAKDREAKGEGASYRNAAAPTGGTDEQEAVDGTQAGADWSKVKVHVGKNAGVELRDLDPEAIEKLVANWLPVHAKNAKPTADDKRLAAALELAVKELAAATAGGDF